VASQSRRNNRRRTYGHISFEGRSQMEQRRSPYSRALCLCISANCRPCDQKRLHIPDNRLLYGRKRRGDLHRWASRKRAGCFGSR